MNELLEYLKVNGDTGWGYDAEEAIYGAKNTGLIETVEYLGSEELDERRWGRDTLYVYKLDDKAVGIKVYVMYSDEGENEFEDVYYVEPYEVVETRWRRVSE